MRGLPRSRRGRAGALAAVIVLLAGAGVAVLAARRGAGPSGPRPTGTPSSEEPRRGGTLRVLLAEDADLDPQRADRPEEWFFARALHRGLMAFPNAPFPAGARPVPDLAEAPPAVSADGLTYRFRLRAGVRFGPPASRRLTSRDVRAGIERLLRMDVGIARFLTDIRGARRVRDGRARTLSGIRTPDARTVVVRLDRPASDVLWMLAHPQASAVPAELARRTRVAPEGLAGAGPYLLRVYRPERRISLRRNPEWSSAADPVRGAHVDTIDAMVGLTARTIDRRVADGKADLAPDVSPMRSTRPQQNASIVARAGGCLRYLFLNTRVDPFDDVRVRRAVAAALDRGEFVRAAARAGTTRATLVPAGGVLPPTVFGSSPDVPSADPRGARSLLRDAGFRRGFSATMIVGDTAEDRRQGAAVRSALRAARIRVRLRTVPVASLYPDHYERPAAGVPMGLATWCADWPGLGGRAVIGSLLDGRDIRREGNTVSSQLRSRSLERRIDAALGAPDEEEAARRWGRADRAAARLAAVIPLARPEEAVRISPRLMGFLVHPLLSRGDPANVWLGG